MNQVASATTLARLSWADLLGGLTSEGLLSKADVLAAQEAVKQKRLSY